MGRAVVLYEGMNTGYGITGASRTVANEGPLARTIRRPPTRVRSATPLVIATMFATTWVFEAQAEPGQARHLADADHTSIARNFDSGAGRSNARALRPGNSNDDRLLQIAQATTDDARRSTVPERHWTDTLSCELANARRDIELLQRLEQDRNRVEQLEKELEAARRDAEAQAARGAKERLETSGLKHDGEGVATEQKSLQQERERSEQLQQDLAAARRDVETQTALASKTSAELSRLKQENESSAAELRKSLDEERVRSESLEHDLAAARRDAETQTTLATKASEATSRLKEESEAGTAALQKDLKQQRERAAQLEQALAAARTNAEDQNRRSQAAEASAAELKQAMQKERERANALAQDLSVTRTAVYAYEAQARKATDEAIELRQAAANSAPALCKTAPDERERAERLEQELTAARRDVESQAALAAKTSEEASRLKRANETGAAELQNSLQKEYQRSAQLEQDLAAARRGVETQSALATKAREEASRQKQTSESSVAELQKSLQKEHERSAQLEQDLAVARRGVETQTALAAKAREEASQQKRTSENSVAELQKSLQQERERSARLDQELAAARRGVETQTALTAEATREILRRSQGTATDDDEPRRSRQKANETARAFAEGFSLTRSAIHAYDAQTRRARNQAIEIRQAAANGAPSLDKSVQDARDRTAQLEQGLALARRLAPTLETVGSITRDAVAEDAKPVPDQALATATGARGDPQPRSDDSAAAAGLIARASMLLEQGDIGGARIVLERAVEIGSAQATFSLAETYDPSILAKWGTYGTRGDAIKAQDLYAKAAAAGIAKARERYEALHR